MIMIGWRCGPHIRAGLLTRTPNCWSRRSSSRRWPPTITVQLSAWLCVPVSPRWPTWYAPEREPSGYSPFAARWRGDPAELALVRDGRAGVQDEGSQLVTWALTKVDAPPGWWLDLCAGPGGKSALLAGLARLDGSRLLASDLAPHRASCWSPLRVRAYAGDGSVPTVVVADGTRPPWRSDSFARVLADVPCTGLGALRRRPESRWRRGPADVEQLHPLQLALLASAIDSAAPGGVIGYVTCSPHRRETTDVLSETLAVRADVEVIPAAQLLPEVPDAALGPVPAALAAPARHGRHVRGLSPQDPLTLESTRGPENHAEHPVGRLREPADGDRVCAELGRDTR